MPLPLLFEIGRKLVPKREEGVGRDLLLSRLGFDGEGHAQLREPGEESTAAKRESSYRLWFDSERKDVKRTNAVTNFLVRERANCAFAATLRRLR